MINFWHRTFFSTRELVQQCVQSRNRLMGGLAKCEAGEELLLSGSRYWACVCSRVNLVTGTKGRYGGPGQTCAHRPSLSCTWLEPRQPSSTCHARAELLLCQNYPAWKRRVQKGLDKAGEKTTRVQNGSTSHAHRKCASQSPTWLLQQ